jgi:hypothetical protein
MPRGRPKTRSLDGANNSPVAEEVVPVDRKGRIGIPTAVVRGVAWLSATRTTSIDSLAVFDEPGTMYLHAWDSQAERVLVRQRELVAQGDLEVLRLLQDRYRRIPISSESRFVLTNTDALHFGITFETKSHLYVASLGPVVRFSSPSVRDREILDSAQMFEGMP